MAVVRVTTPGGLSSLDPTRLASPLGSRGPELVVDEPAVTNPTVANVVGSSASSKRANERSEALVRRITENWDYRL